MFLILYFGSLAIIGLSTPGGYYFPFVEKYINFPNWLRGSLMEGCKGILSFWEIDTYFTGGNIIRIVNGRGVRISMDCYGLGVLSFWTGFVLAYPAKVAMKAKWLFGGLFFLWLINVCRIALFLVATNKGWPMPFGLDHHTIFNIIAYTFILVLMYSYTWGK